MQLNARLFARDLKTKQEEGEEGDGQQGEGAAATSPRMDEQAP